jgi:hypothetical protein
MTSIPFGARGRVLAIATRVERGFPFSASSAFSSVALPVESGATVRREREIEIEIERREERKTERKRVRVRERQRDERSREEKEGRKGEKARRPREART